MNIQDFEKILKHRENSNIEFKSTFPKQAHKLAKEMVAFTNTEGGIIFIGVGDDGTIIGVDDPVKADERLTGIAQGCSPPIRLEINQLKKDSKTIVVAKVPRKPLCCYKGSVYVRDGSSSRPAKSNEIIEIVLDISSTKTHSLDNIKLEPDSNSKKIISKRKLRNKALKGYLLTLICFISVCIVFFNLYTYGLLVNIIIVLVFAPFYFFNIKKYGDEMLLYKTVFSNIKNLESEKSIFAGDGRFIQSHDQRSFLVYKPIAKCIYPHCNGEIIVVNAPSKELLKTRKAYVGICSVASHDHSYCIDYNGIAKKKDIDWSSPDKT